MTIQAVASLSNKKSLCIGPITEREAEMAMESNPLFDGTGLYLLSVDIGEPGAPASVLARFASEDAALMLAQFFRSSGRLELA
jgi:hypothetical protein